MLGRRKPSRAESVAVAQRRLEALESSFPARRVDQRQVAAVDDLDDLDDLADLDAITETEADDGETRAIQRSRPPTRSRGRHAAAAILPARRLTLTPQQLTLLALAVAAVVALAAWWVMRSVPHAEPVQLTQQRVLPSSAGGSGQPVTTAPQQTGAQTAPGSEGTTAGGALVVVDVAGKVRHPGIVELPAGSRVVDALEAAGGAKHGVDTSSLNLARLLVDGEQIVVGVEIPAMPPAGTTGGSSTTSAITPVNLNTATLEQLDTLPGIGPVTAQAILDWRSENGAFTSVDELLEVSGIGDATLADIEAYVYV
jgi:competence protein ComEA